jgi:Bacterial Ig-like domain (group 1)
MVTVKMTITLAFLLLVLVLPNAALAQAAKEATAIRVGAPAQLELGETATVQAVLVDSAGTPIPNAMIYFVSPATFLSASGDMVVAQARTDKDGQAVAHFTNDIAGTITLHAQFRGDDRYAPSEATTQINGAGDAQLYVQQAGVQIPGLNQAPPAPVTASVSQPLIRMVPEVRNWWPSLSGWPIALVLMTVWALYVFALTLIFRIAAPSRPSRSGYNVETGRFE